MNNISIITATYNCEDTILPCIESIDNQTELPYEHIIIDGKSSDSTLDLIKSKHRDFRKIISEKDQGIYDALNKGIDVATGDIICFLHADDIFASKNVISSVKYFFNENKCDISYADLCYVKKEDINSVTRLWKAGNFNKCKLKLGWMPPHPTVFFRLSLVKEYGKFDIKFAISSDYDWILRYFTKDLDIKYLKMDIIRMRMGGVSNQPSKILYKIIEDYKIAGKYFKFPFFTIFFKNIQKIPQLLISNKGKN